MDSSLIYYRLLAYAALVVAVLVFIWALAGKYIAPVLMERTIYNTLTEPHLIDKLPDGLHVLVWGSGGPLPSERKQTCLLVIAGKKAYLVDAGAGGLDNLGQMRVGLRNLEAVFLTHFHSDHIASLGDVMLNRWVVNDVDTPLPVYGPPGVEEIVAGFNLAYHQDSFYRNAHHGDAVVPLSGAGGKAAMFDKPPHGERIRIFQQDGLTVDVFSVDHNPAEPAVGYRFEYGGRSIVISGDTAPTDDFAAHAKDADLLLFEGLSYQLVEVMKRAAERAGNKTLEKIFYDIPDYHTDPVDAARIAEQAGVQHLAFYHIVPPLPIRPLERVFLDGTDDEFSGDITLTKDGLLFSLPSDDDDIDVMNCFRSSFSRPCRRHRRF